MLSAQWCKYILRFKETAITSRSSMDCKATYFIKVVDDDNPYVYGIGECALFHGLSHDDVPEYEAVLSKCCAEINHLNLESLSMFSSIRFGIETALADLRNGGIRKPFPSQWSEGISPITINGLIWMGTPEQMLRRIRLKLESGFRCLKLKIGGCDFNDEISILESIRKKFSPDELEIRLDANGAFSPDDALLKLDRLSKFTIHSIEQPIRQNQIDVMATICRKSSIPIALDEELISPRSDAEKADILSFISPAYIILKPSLCGGFKSAESWIEAAERLGIGWWATSALESNIGLNAIAQWVSNKNPQIPQGLGTGGLYTNNIPSPLFQSNDYISYNPSGKWQIPQMNWR